MLAWPLCKSKVMGAPVSFSTLPRDHLEGVTGIYLSHAPLGGV